MPKIEISFNDLISLVKSNFDLKKLEEYLEFVKGEIDEIKEDKIKIEIKDTNRPDLWSTEGIARELRKRLGIEKSMSKYRVYKSDYVVTVDSNLDRKTVCAVIENVKLNEYALEQIIQLQEKISENLGRERKEIAVGLYDKDKIRFPIRFTAEKPEKIRFVPLDFKEEMNAIEILKKHPKGIKYSNLLKEKKEYPIFIDNDGKILSMPPIINSEDVGKITENTKNIFIECSGFDFRKLSVALNIIVTSIAERGGKIKSVLVEYEKGKDYLKCPKCKNKDLIFLPWLGNIYECHNCGFRSNFVISEENKKFKIITPDLRPRSIILDINYLNKIFGIELKIKEIKGLLIKSGYEIKKIRKDNIEILYPAYRQDIMHQRDVIEDLLISYGYNKIEPKEIRIFTIGEESDIEKFSNIVAEIFVGLGFQEIISYMLTSKKNLFEKMNLKEEKIVEIENPLSERWSVFRNRLLPSLLDFLFHNKNVEYPQKIFEIGDCVIIENNEPKDKRILCVAISDSKVGYEDISSYLDAFMRALEIKYKLIKTKDESFIKGRVANILVNNNKIGIIGEIHPAVLENFNIEMPVACFEIDIEEIFKEVQKRI
jgi:phenylalanyl-tRNA synthetase beta chain